MQQPMQRIQRMARTGKITLEMIRYMLLKMLSDDADAMVKDFFTFHVQKKQTSLFTSLCLLTTADVSISPTIEQLARWSWWQTHRHTSHIFSSSSQTNEWMWPTLCSIRSLWTISLNTISRRWGDKQAGRQEESVTRQARTGAGHPPRHRRRRRRLGLPLKTTHYIVCRLPGNGAKIETR